MDDTNRESLNMIGVCCSTCSYLVVFDGLRKGFHLNSLIQLIFMQQVNEVIQWALMEAHFRVKRSHSFENLHAAGVQSPRNQETGE